VTNKEKRLQYKNYIKNDAKINDYNNEVTFVEKEGLVYIQFKNLKRYENNIIHCFTTRLGGTSKGNCSSLNLGYKSYDSIQNVNKNYVRLCKTLGVEYSSLVYSNQVHGTDIRIVGEKDRNKKEDQRKELEPYDGLATDAKGITLVTFYADCVPILFYDDNKKVIAMAHSGWRGTVAEIAVKTVEKIKNVYGCNPNDLEIAIGPSIGKCCFEVGEEVYEQFASKMNWSKRFCKKTSDNKWHIDLKGIIKQSLLNSGVLNEKICIGQICTKCNKHIFFSHRGDNGKTGSLAAVMQIK
jgi:YfiH family protein